MNEIQRPIREISRHRHAERAAPSLDQAMPAGRQVPDHQCHPNMRTVLECAGQCEEGRGREKIAGNLGIGGKHEADSLAPDRHRDPVDGVEGHLDQDGQANANDEHRSDGLAGAIHPVEHLSHYPLPAVIAALSVASPASAERERRTAATARYAVATALYSPNRPTPDTRRPGPCRHRRPARTTLWSWSGRRPRAPCATRQKGQKP